MCGPLRGDFGSPDRRERGSERRPHSRSRLPIAGASVLVGWPGQNWTHPPCCAVDQPGFQHVDAVHFETKKIASDGQANGLWQVARRLPVDSLPAQ